jgi:ABC-type uncharacterized transport system YnjBCD ATPase subunit
LRRDGFRNRLGAALRRLRINGGHDARLASIARMSDAVLAVEGLRTHFFTKQGVVKAVDDVSFTVGRGEVVGLVGESGSGKSMTGYSIMGLIDPPGRIVGGRILLNGVDVRALPDEGMRRLRGNRVAMIFQDPMMTLNPVLRIDTQMIEAILAHERTSVAAARARARASASLTFSCATIASIIWTSMRSTGFSVIIGSWKIIATRLPRICRNCSADSARRSTPSRMILPATMRPGGSIRPISE